MIPAFPEFKPLEMDDRAEVESVTVRFAPYSDFNFLSLICWDTREENMVSRFGDNLLVRFTDYLTGEPFYSFIGDSCIEQTIDLLLEETVREGLPNFLRLVPESASLSAGLPAQNGFVITEDPDNFDYILDVESLIRLTGGKMKRKRHRVGRLKQDTSLSSRPMHFANTDEHKHILELWETWSDKKGKKGDDYATLEKKAFLRLLKIYAAFNLVAVGLWAEDKLVGFSVNETVHDGYYMGHFGKTDGQRKGLSDFLEYETAALMEPQGCTRVNLQQDLGLEGLRSYKQSLRPVHYLHKYIISG